MRISDWSSDVCSSDLDPRGRLRDTIVVGEGVQQLLVVIRAGGAAKREAGRAVAADRDPEGTGSLEHHLELFGIAINGVGPCKRDAGKRWSVGIPKPGSGGSRAHTPLTSKPKRH